VIHFQTDWTEAEAKALEGIQPNLEYYFVLAAIGPGAAVVSYHLDLDDARKARREFVRGSVLRGKFNDWGGVNTLEPPHLDLY
jgi:hypothetical protein